MATGNYFKIDRDFLSDERWLAEPFTKAQAWLDLIGNARWKAGNFVHNRGPIIPLFRGELIWSEEKLAKKWKWSRGKVRRFMFLLKTEQQIEVRTVQGNPYVNNVIRVINYDKYQGDDTANEPENEHPTDTERTPNGHRTVQERRKVKEREEGEASFRQPNETDFSTLIDLGIHPAFEGRTYEWFVTLCHGSGVPSEKYRAAAEKIRTASAEMRDPIKSPAAWAGQVLSDWVEQGCPPPGGFELDPVTEILNSEVSQMFKRQREREEMEKRKGGTDTP